MVLFQYEFLCWYLYEHSYMATNYISHTIIDIDLSCKSSSGDPLFVLLEMAVNTFLHNI